MATSIEELNISHHEHMEFILNSLPGHIFYMDIDKRIIWANCQGTKSAKMDLEEIEGQYCYDVHFKESGPCSDCLLDKVISDSQPHSQEMEKDDGSHWLMTAYPIFDEDGQLKSLVEITFDITDTRRTEKALRKRNKKLNEINYKLAESEKQLKLALMGAQAGFWDWNVKKDVTYYDENLLKLLGYNARKEVPSWEEMVHPEDYPQALTALENHLEGKTPYYEAEYRLQRKNGDWMWLVSRGKVVRRDDDGRPLRLVGLNQDISHRKYIERKFKEGQEQFKSLFDHNPDAIAVVNTEGKFINVNPVTEKITGYRRQEMFEQSFRYVVHPQDISKADHYFEMTLQGEPQEFESTIIDKEGNYVELSVKLIPMRAGGTISGAYIVAKDITQRKRAENRIKYMAHHDFLTKLPNRNLLNKYFKEAILASESQKMALLFIDLDNFKRVNDSLGHKAGDKLIKKVSERLTACVRQKDIVFRHSGDEFIVFVENILSKEKVRKIAKTIIHEFTRPFYIDNYKVFVTPSIGISIFPDHGKELDHLVKRADLAMFQVKKNGRNNYNFYNAELDSLVSQKLYLENELRKALANDQLSMYYQPQIDLKTGQIVAVEALIRWNHPELGYISPGEFIPIAEEMGLIIPIGDWILKKVCQQTKEWFDAGYHIDRAAVNISIRQFQDKHLVEKVERAIKESGLPPEHLELEITESIMRNVNDLAVVLEELKGLGVKISVDDFGTGYSSLSVIQNLPIDALKIDQSFIDKCLVDDKSAALVKTIIDMGHNLSFAVVAEGIEEEEQAEFLRTNTCLIGQGYLYSKAIPFEEIFDLLDKGKIEY